MNIFIIHSGDDREKVQNIIDELIELKPHIKALILDGEKKIWKPDATRKMKESNIVLVFLGKDTHKRANVGWEIKKAKKLNKSIYIVKLQKEFLVHKELKSNHAYSREEDLVGKEVTIKEFTDDIDMIERSDLNLFNAVEMDWNHLMEQYKLFIATSEALVERRQRVSNFYIMVNTALVSLLGTMTALDIDLRFKLIISFLFPIIGIVIAKSWINLLESYGRLNSSKMSVIQMIEQKLPLSLFEAEWNDMSNKLNNRRYVSFTDSEKKIPNMFIVLYFIVLFFSATYYFYSFMR